MGASEGSPKPEKLRTYLKGAPEKRPRFAARVERTQSGGNYSGQRSSRSGRSIWTDFISSQPGPLLPRSFLMMRNRFRGGPPRCFPQAAFNNKSVARARRREKDRRHGRSKGGNISIPCLPKRDGKRLLIAVALRCNIDLEDEDGNAVKKVTSLVWWVTRGFLPLL